MANFQDNSSKREVVLESDSDIYLEIVPLKSPTPATWVIAFGISLLSFLDAHKTLRLGAVGTPPLPLDLRVPQFRLRNGTLIRSTLYTH